MKDYYSHPRHQAASHEHGWLRMDYSGEFERDRMRTKMRGWGWRLVVTMALMLVVGLGGCQTFPQAEKALRIAGVDKSEIGALVHGSVCRDYLEPATACCVHHRLGLPRECMIYDVSNACLGILNGIVQVAGMIELGQIRAGIVVGTESARPLVENTIRTLN
ncbi:hypothetical protein LCGC14_2845230, partial [marine sediment metagenome]